MTQQKGLKERMMEAGSVEDVQKILKEGECYLNATDKTRNKWKRIAEKRIAQLSKKK